MIPKILQITEENKIDETILSFAGKIGALPSYTIIVRPEKDELTVDQIHLMKKDIQVGFTQTVLVVLLGLDYSSNEVQNSLLKCLEDDAERIQFLFLVKNPSRLLTTITSRCSLIESNAHSLSPISSIVASSDIFSFKNNTETTKEVALEKIDRFLQSSSVKDHRILHHILSIRKLITDNNMNPVLALDDILIFLLRSSSMKVTHE